MEGGKWGLVIIASAFLIQVFAFGLSASIGVYNIEFLDYFENDTVGVSLIASLNWATFLGSGPLASFLMQKISYRKIALLGSALVVLGVGLMPFLPYIPAYCLCFGLLAGLGSCLVYVPSHVLCGLYYERHQSLATGFATSGSGLGGAIMPIVFGKLIEHFGWKGSLLVVAGLQLHLFVCAALLRAPPETKNGGKRKASESEALVGEEKCAIREKLAETKPVHSIVKVHKNGDIRASLAIPEDTEDLLLDGETDMLPNGGPAGEEVAADLPVQNTSSNGDAEGGKVLESIRSTDNKIIKSNRVRHDSTEDKNNELKNCVAEEKDSLSLNDEVKVLRHIYLFTDIGFNVYFFSSIFWNAGAAVVMAFGPDFMVERGISPVNAAWLLTIFGLGDFIGGVIGGVIGNIWTSHRQAQYIAANVVFGVCVFVYPVGWTFGEFAAILMVGGLAFGVVLGLLVVVLIDLIGTESLVDGLGYVMLANGVGAFSGPAIAGYIRKVTGAYDLAFYMGGTFGILGGVSMWLIPLIYCICPSKNPQRKKSQATMVINAP